MASSSNSTSSRSQEFAADEGDEKVEEELERFDDFTIASSWERFISEIEALCRLWMSDGPTNLMEKSAERLSSDITLYKVKSELKYSAKLYCIEYYFETSRNGKISYFDEDNVHDLQLCFGVSDFLVIAPVTASGVVLDAPESTKLLSAIAIALTNCCSNWPAFVPVHDPSRKSYIGIQNMDLIFTRRFNADRIGSQVPVRLMHLEGLYELFVSKFALFSVDFSTSTFKVHFEMKLTYRTPPNDYDDVTENIEPEVLDSKEETSSNQTKSQWDDDCPWTEWYSAEDPIRGFELVASWSDRTFEGSLEMAELENTSSFDAEKWLLYPVISAYMIDDATAKFIGFASQLRLLVNALDKSFMAQFLEDFVSAENPVSDGSKSASTVPPPTVVDRVLKDIFHDGDQISPVENENKHSRTIKGAPLDSLFAQFCLHSLWFGGCNIRAIAFLWIEFVREVRWYWEESQPLPRTGTKSIELSACLVHQKLQMLSICIARKNALNQGIQKSTRKEHTPADSKVLGDDGLVGKSSKEKSDGVSGRSSQRRKSKPAANMSRDPIDEVHRGSAGVVGSMMLLNSRKEMHKPYTQHAPIMTEDMHEERLHAVEALGDAFSFSGQLERDILSSDMSAFKAANPDAVFEDFIRWHSPGDWESDEIENGSVDHHSWPPRGKLSQRMSEHGNVWRKLWNESVALPVAEQKPLLDPIREGEKILHYLETLKPHQLLEQMVCTAFRASADTLSQTIYGDFKPMKLKMSQLYLTLASTLKHLQGDKVELISDLRRLCLVLEHVEKLVILAASIHRKLLDAPRLSEAVFNDFFDFYLPKMGTSLKSICYDKEFNAKQLVMMNERDAVASLFPPPTANQSWRKVLSMGNLLNGHEPVLREIIFSVYDTLTNSHYDSNSLLSREVETHRMYICGTSNDLRVALTVTSWD